MYSKRKSRKRERTLRALSPDEVKKNGESIENETRNMASKGILSAVQFHHPGVGVKKHFLVAKRAINGLQVGNVLCCSIRMTSVGALEVCSLHAKFDWYRTFMNENHLRIVFGELFIPQTGQSTNYEIVGRAA